MRFIIATTVLALCVIVLTTEAKPTPAKGKRAVGLFGNTFYKGRAIKTQLNRINRLIFGISKLTDPSAKPPTEERPEPTPLAEFTAQGEEACSITYDAGCVPNALAILPLNIRSTTICGPGWTCYE